MADAMVSAVVGPKARFFSRERVDEIVLLLREAEKALIDVGARDRAQRLAALSAVEATPPADQFLARLKAIMADLHKGNAPHCHCGVSETLELIRDWSAAVPPRAAEGREP